MGIEETPPPPKQRSITFLSMEEQGTNYIDYTCKVGGILTIDNLIKKNLPLVNCCCLRQCDEETMDHLLLHCKIAHALWREGFFLCWVSVGDAENSYLSSFHLEELVGELFFKCLEYGTSMSNVVSMEGMQWLNF